MLRIVQFTDVHFGLEHKDACAAARDFAQSVKPALVLVTGDITQRGLYPEFQAAAAWLKSMPAPWLCCPGNHDTAYYNVFLRLIAPWHRFDACIGPQWREGFRAPGLALEAINTARGIQLRGNWSKGKIDLAHARAAAEKLRAAPAGDLRVVALHHPLLEVVGEPITAEVREGGKAVDFFTAAGVDLVLSGHLHVPFATPLPCADKLIYTVGGSTLSVRERGAPIGFNYLEIDEATITVNAMGWKDGAFAATRTWRLPRRGGATATPPLLESAA